MSNTRELVEQLSVEERSFLAEIGQRSSNPRVPSGLAEKLLSLGLVELILGHLDLTGTGRRALQVMKG